MESIDAGNGVGAAVGIARAYSNFMVVFATYGNVTVSALRENTTIEVTAKDKATLYTQSPDRRIPKEVREQKHGKFPKGTNGGYLFFPYDADAYDLSIVVRLPSVILRFPFSRTPAHMEFGDPAVVKTTSSTSIAGPPLMPDVPVYRSAPTKTSVDCDPPVESHIAGEFNGWDSETIYKLDNGDIWQQSNYHYHYHYSYHPAVLIYRNRYGTCHIKVEGDNDEGVDVIKLR